MDLRDGSDVESLYFLLVERFCATFTGTYVIFVLPPFCDVISCFLLIMLTTIDVIDLHLEHRQLERTINPSSDLRLLG